MRNLMIFSGAGISADSGISTFRDHDGLWKSHRIEDVCTASSWARNSGLVHEFYNARRVQLGDCLPNPAHQMVRRIQQRYPGASIVTQNVDDLFEQACCENVIHVHGRLTDMRCDDCGRVFDIGKRAWEYGVESCLCGSSEGVRPGIVMFGDMAPMYRVMYEQLEELRKTRGVLVVIGTSGQVVPIDEIAEQLPGMTILSNLETAVQTPGGPAGPADWKFKKVLHGRASVVAPTIEAAIVRAMSLS